MKQNNKQNNYLKVFVVSAVSVVAVWCIEGFLFFEVGCQECPVLCSCFFFKCIICYLDTMYFFNLIFIIQFLYLFSLAVISMVLC